MISFICHLVVIVLRQLVECIFQPEHVARQVLRVHRQHEQGARGQLARGAQRGGALGGRRVVLGGHLENHCKKSDIHLALRFD